VFFGESALKPTNSVMYGFDCEPFAAKALREEPAQLDIIIDDENAIHFSGPAASDSILDHRFTDGRAFTKLYLA
jgi:hypothetical protein